VPFSVALRFWLWLGFASFGGPAGQIALMHRELVERRRWITENRFLHALNFCMLLPGPEAQQLATYVGWLLHRTAGGIAAGGLFVLPSIFILLMLSCIYAVHGAVPAVSGTLAGVKPVVVALVALAVVRIGRRSLRQVLHAVIALGSLVVAWLRIPFPLVLLAAAALSLVAARAGWTRAKLAPDHSPPGVTTPEAIPAHARPSGRRAARILGVAILLWIVPLGTLVAWRGTQDLFVHLYRFFTQVALVTFGGAYAVLAYVLQSAVHPHGWITSAQALDGLALAETTPGPLIMVLQFVGFMAGWSGADGLTPMTSAVVAALLTTYATFLPSFTLVFLGAPYIETLRHSRALHGALAGVTAAAVGVIAHLGLSFGRAVLWPGGVSAPPDVFALAVMTAAAVVLASGRVGTLWVIGAGAALGLARAIF
jgi:chromate transporter